MLAFVSVLTLCVQGIPADDIFADDFEAIVDGERFGEDIDMVEGRDTTNGMFDSDVEDVEGGGRERGDLLDGLSPADTERDGERGLVASKQGPKFSEKLVEEYQTPWQPSATPTHLQHRFMVRGKQHTKIYVANELFCLLAGLQSCGCGPLSRQRGHTPYRGGFP